MPEQETKQRPPQISTSVSQRTKRQADRLREETGYNLHDLVTQGIQIIYEREFGGDDAGQSEKQQRP